jgi:hypothetical protein
MSNNLPRFYNKIELLNKYHALVFHLLNFISAAQFQTPCEQGKNKSELWTSS